MTILYGMHFQEQNYVKVVMSKRLLDLGQKSKVVVFSIFHFLIILLRSALPE